VNALRTAVSRRKRLLYFMTSPFFANFNPRQTHSPHVTSGVSSDCNDHVEIYGATGVLHPAHDPTAIARDGTCYHTAYGSCHVLCRLWA
jgi:hypothetical protein